nr:MAG TPA: hypothetical protein [Caudoviricetes sp.]
MSNNFTLRDYLATILKCSLDFLIIFLRLPV